MTGGFRVHGIGQPARFQFSGGGRGVSTSFQFRKQHGLHRDPSKPRWSCWWTNQPVCTLVFFRVSWPRSSCRFPWLKVRGFPAARDTGRQRLRGATQHHLHHAAQHGRCHQRPMMSVCNGPWFHHPATMLTCWQRHTGCVEENPETFLSHPKQAILEGVQRFTNPVSGGIQLWPFPPSPTGDAVMLENLSRSPASL